MVIGDELNIAALRENGRFIVYRAIVEMEERVCGDLIAMGYPNEIA